MSLDRGENWRRYERACKSACERLGRVYDAAIATRALMVDNDYPEEAAERMPLSAEVVVIGTDGTPWTVEDILRREA